MQITVTILACNSAQHLSRVLEALRPFDEVLILDSGSTDETLAIAGKFPGLRELLDKNQLRHRDINLKMPDALAPGTIVVAEIPPDANLDGFFGESKKLIFTSGALPRKPWILDAKPQTFLVYAPPPEDFRESPLAQRMLLALLR